MDTSTIAADARYTLVESPLGWVEVWASPQGVMRVTLRGDDPQPPRDRRDGRLFLSAPADDHPMLRAALRWLSAYFEDAWEAPPTPPVHLLQPDTFSGQVLSALQLQVPLGAVVSYGQLAELAGHPEASRAVGQVMAANPIPLLVPCHRVVRSNGRLGQYSAGDGATTKAWLLDHEGVDLQQGQHGMWVELFA